MSDYFSKKKYEFNTINEVKHFLTKIFNDKGNLKLSIVLTTAEAKVLLNELGDTKGGPKIKQLYKDMEFTLEALNNHRIKF